MQTLIKTLIVILLTASLSWAETTVIVVGQPVSTACTTPADGDVFNEGFIGTGYENAGWTETIGTNGIIDEDFTLTGSGWSSGACTEGLRIYASAASTYVTVDLGTTYDVTSSALDVYFEFQVTSESFANGDLHDWILIRNSSANDTATFNFYQTSDTFGFYAGTIRSLTTGSAHTLKIHLDPTAASSYIQMDGGTQYTFTRSQGDVRSIRIGSTSGGSTPAIDTQWGRIWLDRP